MLGKLLGNPWTLVVIAVAAFGAGVMVSGWKHDAALKNAVEQARIDERAAFSTRDAAFTAQQSTDQALSQSNAVIRDALTQSTGELLTAIKGQKFTIPGVATNEKPCPDSRSSPSYRLCLNAAYSGDPTDIAACAAGGGHATLPDQLVPPP